MATQDVRFIIAVEDAGAIRKLTETERALYDLQNTTKKADSAFENLWKGFAVGSLAVSALHKGFQLLKGFFESSITEAIEAEQAQHRLGVALELTGRFGVSAKDSFIAFSQEQQNLTLYTDEQIQATMTLLAQMTKLDTEGLRKATKGVMGLATVMNVDLDTAARRVMVAMAGNTEGLSRYGIHVDSTLPKQAQMIQALEQMVDLYPRATAELATMGGQISTMKKNWGELKEGVGGMLLEALNAKENIALLNDVLKAMKKTTEESKKPLDDFNLRMRVMRGSLTSFAADEMVTAAAAKELDAHIRALADDFFKDFYPATEKSTVILHKLTTEALDAKKAFDDLKAANLDMLLPWGDIHEMDMGEAIDKMFPVPDSANLDNFIESVVSGLPHATSAVKKETNKMTDHFAGFYNSIADGFVRAFNQFKLSLKGFADFFVAIWEGIKQAFFKIIAEMVAKFVAFKILTGLGGLIGGPIGAGMVAAAGGLKFWAEGFHGIVQQPTLALVGERGPERVDVGPVNGRGGGGGGATNINVSIYAYDNSDMEKAVRQRVVPILKEVYAHGGL